MHSKAGEDLAGGAVGVVVLITAILLVCVVGDQIITWLKTGVWPAFPISEALRELGVDAPSTNWIGAQKLIDWALGLHVSVLIIALASAAAYAAYGVVSGLCLFINVMRRPLPPRR